MIVVRYADDLVIGFVREGDARRFLDAMRERLGLHAEQPLSVHRPRERRRGNWLSNLVFETYDDIIDAACEAWRKLIAQPQAITSIGMREWAHIGQTPSLLVLGAARDDEGNPIGHPKRC